MTYRPQQHLASSNRTVRYTNAGFNINHTKAETHHIAIMSLRVCCAGSLIGSPQVWRESGTGTLPDDILEKVC